MATATLAELTPPRAEFLALVPVTGKRVVDVGCGKGELTRLMAARGARVVGIECSEAQLAQALAAPRVADEAILKGVAEALPLADGSFDVVVMFNSLHHVDAANRDAALAEARRVLVAGGILFLSEPLTTPLQVALGQLFDQEADAHADAYRAIKRAAAAGFVEVRELTVASRSGYDSFEAYREHTLDINPGNRAAFLGREAEIRAAFERLAIREDGRYLFDRPLRFNLLRKKA